MNMSQPEKIKIILSGGGTGGHIFPAIAIANAIKAIKPEAEVLFIGAKGRMEMEKVPAAGYPITGLWISGLQRRLTLDNLSFPFKVISSLYNAWKIIRKFNPDIVIGTGGYASGPTLRIAAMLNIPTLIQEQNSFPGITNKMLAKKVDAICVAYEGMNKFFPAEKIKITGNPVRNEIVNNTTSKEAALEHFGLNPTKKTVLVVGGSLGARTINSSVNSGLEHLVNSNLQLIWQTGKTYIQTAELAASKFSKNEVYVSAFIIEMDKAYAAADLVVSRAGAIAISELCVAGKPIILVPSPNVAEDHQTKNALSMVGQSAAIMIKDSDALQKLIPEIIQLSSDSSKINSLSDSIKHLAYPNAAQNIAQQALNLIKQNKQ